MKDLFLRFVIFIATTSIIYFIMWIAYKVDNAMTVHTALYATIHWYMRLIVSVLVGTAASILYDDRTI